MGLVVPGGHRWHRNPPSRSEKVTQNTGETPPTYSPNHSLLLTDSSGRIVLGLLVSHQSSECSTIILFKCGTEAGTEMPLKCQTTTDLSCSVIDDIVARAEFNEKHVAL